MQNNKLDLQNKFRYLKSSALALKTNLVNFLSSLMFYLKLDKIIPSKLRPYLTNFIKYMFTIIIILNITILLVWLIHNNPFTTFSTIVVLVIGWCKAVWTFYGHVAGQTIDYAFNCLRYGIKGAEYIANNTTGGWFRKPKVVPTIPSVDTVANTVRDSLRPLEQLTPGYIEPVRTVQAPTSASYLGQEMMRDFWRNADAAYQSRLRPINSNWINWDTAKTAAIYAGMGVIAIGAIGLTVQNWDTVSSGIIGGMKSVGNGIGVTATYTGKALGTVYGYIHAGVTNTYSTVSTSLQTLGSWVWSRPTSTNVTTATQSIQSVADIVTTTQDTNVTDTATNIRETAGTISSVSHSSITSPISQTASVRHNLEVLLGLTPPTEIGQELSGLIPNTVSSPSVSSATGDVLTAIEASIPQSPHGTVPSLSNSIASFQENILQPQPVRPSSLPAVLNSFNPGNVGLTRTNTPLAGLYSHIERMASHTGPNSPAHGAWQELLSGGHATWDGTHTPSSGIITSSSPAVTITPASSPTPPAIVTTIDSSLLVPLPETPVSAVTEDNIWPDLDGLFE